MVAPNPDQFRSKLEEFEVLGALIGTENHHAYVSTKKLKKTQPLLDRLQQFDDPDSAYGILKICIVNRYSATKPSVTKDFLLFDNAQSDCLETLIKGNITCSNWRQANLPIKLGGLGLGCSSDQHLAAFINSVESASSTVEALIRILMKPTLKNELG